MNRYIHTILCITFSILLPLGAFAQAPVANFTANNVSGCSPIVAQFTDLSTNTPTSWYWDLGNGSTSTLKNPSTTYITAGTYTVVLTATNASGSDTKTSVNYIVVAPSPTVAFTADSTPSCALPRTVTFSNFSVAGGSGTTSYLWDFGDGTTSTATNPTKTYNTAGNYSVVLLVTNGNSCSNSLTKPNYIKVSQKPVVGFTTNDTVGCTPPFTATFTNTTTGAVSYEWDFGDGGTSTATSPSRTYTTSGTYTVRLIATNASGCKDTITKTGYVKITKPVASFTASSPTGCTNKSISFTNTSTPAGYTSAWSFGDGGTSTATSPSRAYTASGTYNVRLIVTRNGCSDTTFRTVTIAASPVIVAAGSPTVGCSIPHTVNFTNTTTGAVSYQWTFGDGNTSTATAPSNTYTAFGTYNTRLIAIASNGCADTAIGNAYIKVQQPTATVTVGSFSGCAPVSVPLTANVTTLIPVSNYSWDFGDGSSTVSCATCSTQNHTYSAAGTYTVRLTYTTGTGCTFTAQTNVNIGTKPTAAFSAAPTNICPQTPVTFTNSSTGAGTYIWLFGDGGTSTVANPVYNGYEYPGGTGAYTVRLVANNNGCRDTATRTNYINVYPPRARFGLATTCADRYTVTLSDSSLGADTYSWNWGDGNTSSQAGGSLSHTYAAVGTYTITLTVNNTTYGCSSTFSRTINVQPLTASFTATDTTLCKGQTTFINVATSPAITSYKYYMGESSGASVTLTTPTYGYAYAAGGIYTVKVVVSDANGCKDSMTRTNYLRVGGATVAFSASPTVGCLPLTVMFTDNSTPNGGFPIVSREWFYGYGPTELASGTTISTTYVHAGSWPVLLKITDAKGCVDSLRKPNYITTGRPVAQFFTNDTAVCVGKPVVIYNNSGGNDFTCMWYWGDGTTSTQLTPTHTYTAPGVYTIRLVITDAIGCKDSMIRTNYVNVVSPTVNFTLSDTAANCPPLAVNLTNASTSVTSYSWFFDNGGQSSLANPSTLYTYPGTYNIKLIGTSIGGCKDSMTKQVVVKGPTGTFSYSPLTGCNPLTVNFTSSTTGATQLIWDMSNGVTQNTTTNTHSYTYTQTGKFVPKLILSDGASCLVPIQGLDTIKVDFIDGNFSYASTSSCISSTVQFTDTVLSAISPIATRSWTFGDGGTSTAHNPSHVYTTSGTYNVRLIITNTKGCSDTTIKQVLINAAPNVSAANNQSICAGSTAPVTITATGAATYVWTPSAGLSCTACASPTALPSATTTYIVTGTDTNGCTDTGKVIITVAPGANVSASAASASICNGASTVLTATGGVSYVWTPVGSLSCSTCAGPTASPTGTTSYIVTGTDANGCTDTGTVTVTVNPRPTVGAGADQTICEGTSATLAASSAASYVWSPATGLSCTACAGPTASPVVTTKYVVTGTSSTGCVNTDTVIINVNPKPTVSGGGNKSACSGISSTLNATGALSYVWSPSAGLSCTACASPTATPASTTTYTVTGTDGNGCTNTDNVIVSVGIPPNVNASANVRICDGTSTTLTATGAVSYAWSPTTGLSCSTCAAPTASPTATTTYIVTGTAANGCTDTAMVTVSVDSKPVLIVSPAQTICNGNSVTLSANGATSYIWTPATGLSCSNCAGPVASPTATTTYTVVGTGSNGCASSATVLVNVNPKPPVSAGSNIGICTGSSTTLNATGASTYTWSPSATLSCANCASPVATPASNTTYTVTGTNTTTGCINTATVTVTVNPRPNVSAGMDVSICNGSSTTLTASGATSYTWSPATGLSCVSCTAPTATPITTSTYAVTGTDGNGCTASDTVIVTVNPRPTVVASPNQTICAGTSASISATGAASYTWSPSAGLSCTTCANPTATPAATTTYTVTGTAANGCINTATVTVTVDPKPVIVTNTAVTICAGSSTSLVTSGGSTYSWSPATGLSCTNCASPIASPTTTTIYTVTVAGANGCVNTATVTVTVSPLPDVTVSGAKTICVGETANLLASGAQSYTWSPATGLSCTTCPNPIASPAVTTVYTVTGAINGCVNTATVTVTVRPQPPVNGGGNKEICIGDTVKLSASGASTYTWSPATGLSCTTCTSPTATPSASTTYTITGTDGDGCTNTANVTVTVNPLPNINAGADQTICNGSDIRLHATGGVSYTWSGGSALSCIPCPDPIVKPTVRTTYTVKGIDAKGCVNTDDVTISVIDKSSVSVGPGDSICKGESTVLHASGATSYEWIPSNGLNDPRSANPSASPDVTTTYKLIMKQGDCFVDTNYVTVVVNDIPTVSLGEDMKIIGGNEVQLFAKTNMKVSYSWTPTDHLSCIDCQSPMAAPQKRTTYIVTVTSEAGCKASDDITIHVTCDNSQLFLANTFTPNNDGINDMFYPQGKGINTVKSFTIYNRWGEVLFSRNDMPLNDPLAGWDGTHNGTLAKPDVFVYIINAYCESGEIITLKGDISLIR